MEDRLCGATGGRVRCLAGTIHTLKTAEDLRPGADPFERADHESIGYSRWRADRTYLLVPAQAVVGNFLKTFKEFPPRQKPGSFSIDQVLQKLQTGGTGSN